jgi:ABC-type transport system involved in multi-copper enzyme maturation permease subunit
MSTDTTPRPATAPAPAPTPTPTTDTATGRVARRPAAGILRRAVAAEWIKLRTLRSTWYVLAVTVLGLVVLAALSAVGTVVDDSAPTDATGIGPLGGALAGIPLAELAVAVLGVLAVSGEYGSGLVRVTLAAIPRRWPVVVAKALVVAGAVFVSSLVAVAVAFATSALVLAVEDVPTSLTAPGALRALLAGPVYLAGISALGVAFGWLLRSTAGALAGLFVVLYVLPIIGFIVPDEVSGAVVRLLPGNAGNAMMQLAPSGLLSPGAGFALFTTYTVVTLAAGSLVLRRRDA